MRVWIDARQHDAGIAVFGMCLLERQLRALLGAKQAVLGIDGFAQKQAKVCHAMGRVSNFVRSQLCPTEVHIELPAGGAVPRLPEDLLSRLPIRWHHCGEPASKRLQRLLREPAGGPVIALSADLVVDARLLEHLLWSEGSIAYVDETERAAVLRLEEPPPDGDDVFAIARGCVEQGAARCFSPDDFDPWIRELRRTLPPYVFRVRDDATRRRVERFLFDSNYKGSTDFLTKHAYPPFVWRMVGPLARRRVHPNRVTAISIAATFAAIPFFAAGLWLPGILLAFAMSVLDSVDGKLARVTFTSSTKGRLLDHGTDLVHPPIWYCAWAWGLSAGIAHSALFQASLWLAALYVVDRVLEKLFKIRTGRSLQAYRPLDVRLRTFASRRNVNLALFAVALPFGLGVPAFWAIVALQVATAGYHLCRLIQFWKPESQEAQVGPVGAQPLLVGPGAA